MLQRMPFWMPVYRALSAALAPFARRKLARGAAAFDDLSGREAERRGQVPEASGELWVHAASVGELNAARPLIGRLLARRQSDGGSGIVLTTLTPTAAAQALAHYRDRPGIRTLLAPLDRPADVRAWLDGTRPARLLLIETELWPELLTACRQRQIPVAMANARLSARTVRSYRRFAGLFRPLIAGIKPIACQTRTDAERFARLGARSEAIHVTGNVKFDPAPVAPLRAEVAATLEAFEGRPSWVAGSTHRGEESVIAKAHRSVLAKHPEALLVVVPRHPERADEAEEALREAGLEAVRLSRLESGTMESSHSRSEKKGVAALVVDRLGLLSALYERADANFVGGSLVEGIGGHNLIEAALAGHPVLTGPFTDDQSEAAAGLEAVDGLARVQDEHELAAAITDILAADRGTGRFEAMPRNAAEFLAAQRGALDRTMDVLSPWLEAEPGQPPGQDAGRASR
jgi:3-deoxy-D-manno-octulosonic-acid transferase